MHLLLILGEREKLRGTLQPLLPSFAVKEIYYWEKKNFVPYRYDLFLLIYDSAKDSFDNFLMISPFIHCPFSRSNIWENWRLVFLFLIRVIIPVVGSESQRPKLAASCCGRRTHESWECGRRNKLGGNVNNIHTDTLTKWAALHLGPGEMGETKFSWPSVPSFESAGRIRFPNCGLNIRMYALVWIGGGGI